VITSCFSVEVAGLATTLQLVWLHAFHVSVKVPTQLTHSASPSEPSSLQKGRDAAATTHHAVGGSGQRGVVASASMAGHPKHTAIPAPIVSVGVTNIRSVFVGEVAHKYHHAHSVGKQVGPSTYVIIIGDPIKYGIGTHGTYQQVICNPVSIEKIGSQVSADISPIGNPRTFGALPGASGAQLTGIFKQPPQPNQHEIPRISVSIDCSICAISLPDGEEVLAFPVVGLYVKSGEIVLIAASWALTVSNFSFASFTYGNKEAESVLPEST
jgi:hypothetical protein